MKQKILMILLLASVSTIACGKKLQILVDGSSTVYPITEAVAEEYRTADSSVNVTVGVSGTGGGFKKFCNKETDISDASRPIKSKEIKKCETAKVSYLELAVAYDGLAVITHKDNSFVENLTVTELKMIFKSELPAKTWQEVRSNWPAEAIKIYAPGQDSGTYDYFTETIIGKKGKVRSDTTFSEDDNVLVTGIAGDKNSIGFFGLAYYKENKDKLKLISVVNPKTNQAVAPNLESVKSGSYAPLSRPIFIYVSSVAVQKPEVRKFAKFYLEQAGQLSKEVGYIPLEQKLYQESIAKLATFSVN